MGRSWKPASWWENFIEAHPALESFLEAAQPWLPPLNFITIHWAYFIVVSLVSSIVFWASSRPSHSISYVDSLFHVVSAMTEAGLNTVNLSAMTTWQQIMLWLLIMVGSSIWVSFWTVLFRKHVFERRFEDIVRQSRVRRLTRRFTLKPVHLGRRPLPDTQPVTSVASDPIPRHQGAGLGLGTRIPRRPSLPAPEGTLVEGEAAPESATMTGQDATDQHILFAATAFEPEAGHAQRRKGWTAEPDPDSAPSVASSSSGPPWGHWKEFLTKATVGRNAQFHDLTGEERERLGGCEYQALKVLAVLVPLYSGLWQALGSIAVGAYISRYHADAAAVNAVSTWWTGAFYAVSAFNNSGMALLDANMMPFQQSTFVLIVMGLLILAGNTAFPLFLRLTIWLLLRLLKLTTDDLSLQSEKATLEFILKYPRRVYTSLFPSRPTWWLLFMLVFTNVIDWVAFIVMSIGNPTIEAIPPGSRVLDGLFQALAVRSGGFYVVPIGALYPGLQVLYVVMMYISVYPVVITMRHSNVYEERSLGIYAPEDEPPPDNSPEVEVEPARRRRRLTSGPNTQLTKVLRRAITFHGVGVQKPPAEAADESRVSFVTQQIRGQLAHDLWWLVLAIFVIVTIETRNFLDDAVSFSIFNVIFEVVSAYGCVGISVGLPNAAPSFCGGWRSASKLVLCLVMLRGRHRGLPVALDRAVRLPGKRLARDEEEDERIRKAKTSSRQVDGV
jgi:Trk-type K+ transport system membrane component